MLIMATCGSLKRQSGKFNQRIRANKFEVSSFLIQLSLPLSLLTQVFLTTGSLILMWLGEQITQRGIGNGISLLITVGILADLPKALHDAYSWFLRLMEAITSFFEGLAHGGFIPSVVCDHRRYSGSKKNPGSIRQAYGLSYLVVKVRFFLSLIMRSCYFASAILMFPPNFVLSVLLSLIRLVI